MSDIAKIDAYIAAQTGWQRENLVAFRDLVHEVIPEVEEAWKWDVPVFLVRKKLVCAMSTFKGHTKYNFFEGAFVADEHKLFNSGLDSKKHRSINLEEGHTIATDHLKELLQSAASRALL